MFDNVSLGLPEPKPDALLIPKTEGLVQENTAPAVALEGV